MNQEPGINPSEHLQEVLIESPLQEATTLKNVSFIDVQSKAMKDVIQMYKSQFYTSIKIHYGVKERN